MKLSSSVSLLHLFAIMKQMWVVETLSVAVSSRSSAFGRSLRMRTTTTTTTRHQSGYSRSRITMMPEGPEVKTLVDQLQGGVGMQYKGIEFLSGRYVRHGRPATYDEFANTLSASANNNDDTVDSIVEWNAKGKFIYIVLNDGKHIRTEDDDFKRSIWVTLGMSGRFVAQAQQEHQRTEARWALQLSNDGSKVSQIFYHDPRNYGTLKFCLSAKELEAKLKTLGPDILQSDDTTEGIFVDLVAKQKPELNVCKFLMNQKKISGVGNYILAEGLYRANIDPFCCLSELTEDQQRSLFRELQSTALQSYKAQGMTRGTGGAYRDVEGNRGKFEFELQCYGRELCAQRGKPVLKEMDGPHGRTIWYTEHQLFMPRIMRFGDDYEDEPTKKEMKKARAAPAVAKSTQKKAMKSTTATAAVAAVSSDKTRSGDPVTDLAMGLKDDGWKNALSDSIQSEGFADLARFIQSEREQGAVIYPPENEVFSALNLCSLEKVKVVIVGQDPYHGPGQGHGLSFSVRPGIRPPPSLKNIFKEAQADVGIDSPSNGYLECWADQGVLLLNAVMTVRRGEANSHAKKGWETFTDAIINTLNDEKEGLVFLLWGSPAQKKASNVDESKHTVIRTSHPSPLGATKTKAPFLGSKCFSRANEALEGQGKERIDWNVR